MNSSSAGGSGGASTIVFLGPTLPAAEAISLAPVNVRPPAAIGDIYRATAEHPEAILIVDGYFDSVPAVWHKEILYAIAQGVTVYGCSSMGALRSAELHPYGMVGMGSIFRAYLDGVLWDDDEVAVAHTSAETDYRPTSHAMVNIRYGLALAHNRELISTASRDQVLLLAKRLFYPDRHWATVSDLARDAGVVAREVDLLHDFVRAAKPDLKRRDAVEALTRLRDGRLPIGREHAFTFEPTDAWTNFQLRER